MATLTGCGAAKSLIDLVVEVAFSYDLLQHKLTDQLPPFRVGICHIFGSCHKLGNSWGTEGQFDLEPNLGVIANQDGNQPQTGRHRHSDYNFRCDYDVNMLTDVWQL